MRSLSLIGLPSSLLFLIAAHVNAEHPMAIRKMSPNAGEKLLPHDLAFSDDTFTTPLSPSEELLAARMVDDPFLYNASFPYRPPFAEHLKSANQGWEHLRRAAEVLHILESRQSCPTNMNSCENIGSPNKCCMSNEACVRVQDERVGNVACCPKGASCSGAVGACPSGTTSCDAELSGGCCIPGYVCQGVGCVPRPPPAPSTAPTQTATNGGGGGGGSGGSGGTTVRETVTTTTVSTTTLADGRTTTVLVTIIVTVNPGTATTRRSTTTTEPPVETPTTASDIPPTSSASDAVPPFRPTSANSGEGDIPPITSAYCPTGFYACLARAGGGCCQTGRDCATTSCPPTPSTTIVSNGVTVVVPVSDVPEPQATETCASGWFLCGEDGGPIPGCCPSGYQCGTASCSSVSPSETGEIQKHFPNGGSKAASSLALAVVSFVFALL
ncbi:hypothetical protein CH063_00083 [Colletotrichum higginsianum]|uniref:GPI anchored protein n=1 Tax=Colletotrichum higginsianum (strain IMI 349063) TaxID=759273 RepID=H1W2Z3_COLHI|nr:GPI anchored protein [Colletotrichum higginsianum IMI 349063]OBR07505.1 GPI anchored protein [Colletotrichum higginsianum IMI 349063]GJC98377.1 GPI anchored protein [Colletotrichum higginsianum]CCF46856.1 hypothetical protein CH063_00083 [Colletotrichum higginsianum]